jgi:hypothetical protein
MNKIKNFIYNNYFVIFGAFITEWWVSIDRLNASYYHIYEYMSMQVTATNIYLLHYMIFSLYCLIQNKQIFTNKIFFVFTLVTFGFWAHVLKIDYTGFIANHSIANFMFTIADIGLLSYVGLWAVLCGMSIFNTNRGLCKCI